MQKLVIVALAALIAAGPLQAQANPDSVKHQNECRLARQVLIHGQPVAKRSWALGHFVTCGREAPEVVAQVLARHRAETGFGRELDEVVTAAGSVSDRDMALAALRITMDRAAGLGARGQALRLLYTQIRPGASVEYERLMGSGARRDSVSDPGATMERYEPLERDWVIDRPVYYGEPFRPGDLELIAREVAALASSDSENESLREAAEAVARAYRSHIACPRGTPAGACRARFQDTSG